MDALYMAYVSSCFAVLVGLLLYRRHSNKSNDDTGYSNSNSSSSSGTSSNDNTLRLTLNKVTQPPSSLPYYENSLLSPHFLPQRVPIYHYDSPYLNRWVEFLDKLGEWRLVEEYESMMSFLDSLPLTSDSYSAMEELRRCTGFELECLQCVLSWSMHGVGLQQSLMGQNPPVYHPHLIGMATMVSDRLSISIGGCANISFMYNWQHRRLPAGLVYEPRSLTSDDILPRFHILPHPWRSSLWSFLKGHILMEASSTILFYRVDQLYALIVQSQRCEVDPDTRMLRLTDVMRDDARTFLRDINDTMSSVITTMSKYMHVGLINPNYWPMVQQLLKLDYQQQKGISGLQNCWIFAMNFVMGVEDARDPHNKSLELLAWPHLLRHQLALMKSYEQRRHVMRDWVCCVNDDEVRRLFASICERLITWRSIHRTRATKFVETAIMQPAVSPLLTQLQIQLQQLQLQQQQPTNKDDDTETKTSSPAPRSPPSPSTSSPGSPPHSPSPSLSSSLMTSLAAAKQTALRYMGDQLTAAKEAARLEKRKDKEMMSNTVDAAPLKYETAVGVSSSIKDIQKQFDSRIGEFRNLKQAVLVRKHSSSLIVPQQNFHAHHTFSLPHSHSHSHSLSHSHAINDNKVIMSDSESPSTTDVASASSPSL